MEEKDFLLQQIEFLQFQLEDSKLRAAQQKSMYESMLQSLSVDQNPKDNQNSIQVKEQKMEFDLMQHTLQEKIKNLEQLTESQDNELSSLKNEILNIKDEFEIKISALKEEMSKKEENLLKLVERNDELEKKVQERDQKIKELGQEAESLNSKYYEEIFQLEQDHNEKMLELKNLYQTESAQLKNKFSKLESESSSKSACIYFTLLCNTVEKNSEKLKTLQLSLEKIHKDCFSSLSSIPSLQESEISLLPSYTLKEKLDITEKILKLNNSTQQSLESFRFSLNSLRKIVSKTIKKEKSFKTLIESKNNEIDTLKRTISIKAGESHTKDSHQYIEEIIKKDSEICNLKQLIGHIREKVGTNKPPIYTPQHKRSKTLPSPFRLQVHALSDPCQFENDLEECQNVTTASTDRNSETKVEVLMKKIENLKVSMMKIKNQRDRAKNLSEKMLMELKEKKVELALLQEDFSEQKVLIGNHIKSLCGYLVSLSASPILPKILKQDLLRVLNRYTQYINNNM